MLVTVGSIITLGRVYADERPGGSTSFVSDTECETIVTAEAAELYDVLVAARTHEYFKSSDAQATVAGTATYAVPSDFYELLRIEIQWGTRDTELVLPFEQLESHVLSDLGDWSRGSRKAFRVQGSNIEFVPTPTTVTNFTIHYVPNLGTLTSVSNIESVNGWHDAVAMGLAAKLCAIDDRMSQAKYWLEQRNVKLDSIRDRATNRSAIQPARVQDVDYIGDHVFWRTYGRPNS